MTFTTDELRPLAIFEGLREWQLAWFCENGEGIELAPGDRMLERGQPADFMFVMVTGTVEGYEEIGGDWLNVATTRPGDVTGMLPYSRMTHYPRYAVATEPSQVLRIDKRQFQQMLGVSLEVGQRLVAMMTDRARGDVRLEQQHERMISLGRLSAGLAHELNNPAAAVRRTADSLSEQLAKLPGLVMGMVRHEVDETSIDAISQLRRLARERQSPAPSLLEQSAREEELTAWLEGHGAADAWEIAATFADARLSVEDLERFAGQVRGAVLADAVAWVEAGLGADHMVTEITSAAGRISELIASIKTYSHMDRSPEHKPTNIREGLDSTLTMLGHRLKKKSIHLARDYQADLPTIPANAGELNQVWTNLIDNAIDAMRESGQLRIEARRDDTSVDVRIIDDGPGIPEDVRRRIFEPFFTTKGVGEGTGLGLDIARRIVKTHRGQIDVQSRPGRTEMCVRLPVLPASPVRPSEGT